MPYNQEREVTQGRVGEGAEGPQGHLQRGNAYLLVIYKIRVPS